MSAADAWPLLAATLAPLLSPGANAGSPRPLVLAVSGGPDSLVLLLLAAENRDRLRAAGFGVRVATVDHALRPGSAAEAAAVARICDDLALPHTTLLWRGAKPAGNLAGLAREARYGLLADHAETLGAPAVLAAHHEDDQIETHLLAAGRRAGDRGLAGMREARALSPAVLLLRPFLAVPGARLKATVAARGRRAADDPSNRDPRFARARLRLRPGGALEGRERGAVLARIRTHAARREREDAALAAGAHRLRQQGDLAVDAAGVVRLRPDAFLALPTGLREVLLGRLLAAAGGALHPPGRASVGRLAERLRDPAFAGATLGGAAVASVGGGGVEVFREYGRGGLPALAAAGAPSIRFDRRFRLSDPSGELLVPGRRLAAFGATGRGNAVERTLPVLLGPAGETLAAHPALLSKLPASVAALDAAEEVSFRLGADLPHVPDI